MHVAARYILALSTCINLNSLAPVARLQAHASMIDPQSERTTVLFLAIKRNALPQFNVRRGICWEQENHCLLPNTRLFLVFFLTAIELPLSSTPFEYCVLHNLTYTVISPHAC